MEFDTTDFNEEEIAKVNELINSIKKEKESNIKWWIMPKYTPFNDNYNYQQFGSCYYVAEQEDVYSKSCPPLKSNFNSKEEAEKWLKNYLEEESLFKSAKDDVDNLVCNFGHVVEKLQKHEYITNDDWRDCFRMFNESRLGGALFKVTK